MKCPACGAENEKGAAFCFQCGGPLAASPAPSSTGPTVALSPTQVETLEQTPQIGVRPAFRPEPLVVPESGGSRVYQVPGSSQTVYNDTSFGTSVRTSSMAIVALVLGIISFLGLFFIGGIGAIATGHLARREIRASGGQVKGDGMALAGLVLGYANIAVSVLGFIAICLLIAGVLGTSVSP
jgi:hypothetical protein